MPESSGLSRARRRRHPEILAQHASEAGHLETAIDYWQKRGCWRSRGRAYQEAISHINQALRLAESARTDSRVWQERRLQLLLLLGQATIPLRGYSHSQTLTVFTRAQKLVEAMGDARRVSVSYAMWVAYYVRGEHAKAIEVAQGMRMRARASAATAGC